jgi:hypothetical protein
VGKDDNRDVSGETSREAIVGNKFLFLFSSQCLIIIVMLLSQSFSALRPLFNVVIYSTQETASTIMNGTIRVQWQQLSKSLLTLPRQSLYITL